MEDIYDEMSHEGKKYYMSHTIFLYDLEHPLFEMFGNHEQRVTQLVCASNMQNARDAVEKAILGDTGKHITFLQIRIDNPIVGD
ncbi:MAG: hypothetical protein PQJ49_08005 [Sphaerochaetaceae bacterium]|nr:hypothetical protein [Sphaerochaetaceae bacterium]